MTTATTISKHQLQLLWEDALEIAGHLIRGRVPLEVVETTIDNVEAPQIRTKRAPAGRVEVQVWPTDDGSDWHVIPNYRAAMIVIPTSTHPREVAAQIAALHWSVTA